MHVTQEYAPLIAGSLLRVRLEFCVLESFVYESILPFIKARGLSWVFPIKVRVVASLLPNNIAVFNPAP
jgi:hypothetical protein